LRPLGFDKLVADCGPYTNEEVLGLASNWLNPTYSIRLDEMWPAVEMLNVISATCGLGALFIPHTVDNQSSSKVLRGMGWKSSQRSLWNQGIIDRSDSSFDGIWHRLLSYRTLQPIRRLFFITFNQRFEHWLLFEYDSPSTQNEPFVYDSLKTHFRVDIQHQVVFRDFINVSVNSPPVSGLGK